MKVDGANVLRCAVDGDADQHRASLTRLDGALSGEDTDVIRFSEIRCTSSQRPDPT